MAEWIIGNDYLWLPVASANVEADVWSAPQGGYAWCVQRHYTYGESGRRLFKPRMGWCPELRDALAQVEALIEAETKAKGESDE